MKRRTAIMVAGTLLMLSAAPKVAHSQFTLPVAPQVVDGATLFSRQCGTCHVVTPDGGVRQGPNLSGVFGRKAGTREDFRYSSGYANSGITWDAASLDTYLTNPQAMIPGSVMAYRQANADTRATIIGWLKDQH